MGRHHVAEGGALALCAAVALQHGLGRSLGLQFTTEQLAAMALVVAPGASLLIDLDEPNATAARTLGPISQLLCKGISRLTGGHRGHRPHHPSTHDAISWFTVLMITLATLAIRSPVGYMAVLSLCAIWEFRLYGPIELRAHWHIGCIFAGVGTGVLIGHLVPAGSWVPLGIAIGCIAHLLVDVPSDSGLPIFNLVSSTRLRLTWFHTGSPAETIVTWVSVLGALVLSRFYLPATFWYAATVFVGMALFSDVTAWEFARKRRLRARMA